MCVNVYYTLSGVCSMEYAGVLVLVAYTTNVRCCAGASAGDGYTGDGY